MLAVNPASASAPPITANSICSEADGLAGAALTATDGGAGATADASGAASPAGAGSVASSAGGGSAGAAAVSGEGHRAATAEPCAPAACGGVVRVGLLTSGAGAGRGAAPALSRRC